MSWIKLGGRAGPKLVPSASVGIISGGVKGFPKISVALNELLQAEWGVEAGDAVAVLVGSLADSGLLQLTRDPDGLRLRPFGKRLGVHVSCGELAVRPPITRARVVKRYQVRDGDLLLTLPGEIARALEAAIEPKGRSK